MANLKEKTSQLKALLEEIMDEILDVEDSKDFIEKQQQLSGIERTIQGFNKKNVPVPDELRNIKLKLVIEIEKGMEQETSIKELYQALITSLKALPCNEMNLPHKKKRKKKSTGVRITIADLIREDILSVGTQLMADFRGNQLVCTIMQGGQLEGYVGGIKKQYGNPSAIAVALTEMSINGWVFWKIEKRELDYFRKQYLKNMKKKTSGE